MEARPPNAFDVLFSLKTVIPIYLDHIREIKVYVPGKILGNVPPPPRVDAYIPGHSYVQPTVLQSRYNISANKSLATVKRGF